VLQAVLAHYDSLPHRVICIIGYNMIRRSLSARTALCVPTHIICAPSFGTSLADFVQMVGRGMGNNRGVLQRYGLECVRLLAMQEDWQALQQYYDCVEYLHRCVLLGCACGGCSSFLLPCTSCWCRGCAPFPCRFTD
jgi:hypothetical protein